jgi:hypothetical protein
MPLWDKWSRLTVWSSFEAPARTMEWGNRPRIGAWSYTEQCPPVLTSDSIEGGSVMRHIGVDLHKTNFVTCFLAAAGWASTGCLINTRRMSVSGRGVETEDDS